MSNTIIGKNTYLDNQIHVAHNVKIGANCMIAGQVGFAGSSTIGDNVSIGGQAGISGHLRIGNNVKIGAQAGVTKNIEDAVSNAKKGQAMFRNDKGGIIHCSIGKLSFPDQAIKENFISLIEEVKKNRPSSSKGVFIKMITLSSTMGPGLKLNES